MCAMRTRVILSCTFFQPEQGPVVKSIVSLTTSLRRQLVKYMLTTLSNTLLFYVGEYLLNNFHQFYWSNASFITCIYVLSAFRSFVNARVLFSYTRTNSQGHNFYKLKFLSLEPDKIANYFKENK